jgi:hypothetical protein
VPIRYTEEEEAANERKDVHIPSFFPTPFIALQRQPCAIPIYIIDTCPASTIDEDIPTKPLPPSLQDEEDVAVKLKSNEVRIGPKTRVRAKLLKQHVNLFLNDTLIDENFILST